MHRDDQAVEVLIQAFEIGVSKFEIFIGDFHVFFTFNVNENCMVKLTTIPLLRKKDMNSKNRKIKTEQDNKYDIYVHGKKNRGKRQRDTNRNMTCNRV